MPNQDDPIFWTPYQWQQPFIQQPIQQPTPQQWQYNQTYPTVEQVIRDMRARLQQVQQSEQDQRKGQMSNTREYILKPDGSVWRRDIADSELDVSQEVINKLVRDLAIKMPNALTLDAGTVHLCAASSGWFQATIDLNRLIIRAPWKPLGDGVLVPNFSSKTDPVLTVTWTPFKDMKLKFALRLMQDGPRWMHGGAWLFAVDSRGATWRLPLSNVHDDCSCCTGLNDAVKANTIKELIDKMVLNFDQANYNADLWRSAALTQSFFRVKQGDKENNWQTQPTASEWIGLCTKVSLGIQQYIV